MIKFQKNTDPLTSDSDVKYLTENSDLSPLQAKELIEKLGRDRAKLLKEAKKFKAESWGLLKADTSMIWELPEFYLGTGEIMLECTWQH